MHFAASWTLPLGVTAPLPYPPLPSPPLLRPCNFRSHSERFWLFRKSLANSLIILGTNWLISLQWLWYVPSPRLQLSLWIPALSGLRCFLWLLWLYCFFATYDSGYCGYYNQVVALVSLTCHMFTMSTIILNAPWEHQNTPSAGLQLWTQLQLSSRHKK